MIINLVELHLLQSYISQIPSGEENIKTILYFPSLEVVGPKIMEKSMFFSCLGLESDIFFFQVTVTSFGRVNICTFKRALI